MGTLGKRELRAGNGNREQGKEETSSPHGGAGAWEALESFIQPKAMDLGRMGLSEGAAGALLMQSENNPQNHGFWNHGMLLPHAGRK